MGLELIFSIILAGIISENYALLHFLGTGSVIENERSSRRSLLVGIGSTIVMVISTIITWPINKYLLKEIPYFQILVFVVVIMIVVYFIHLFAKNKLETYCQVDFMKFAINGAVLGICIHNTHLGYREAIFTSLGVGIGLTITMIVFGSILEKLDEESVPKAFKGLPISLLIAGFMALALLSIR